MNEKHNEVNLGEIIRKLVKEKGLSDSKFAKSIGMQRQNIKKQIYQKQALNTDVICRINQALKCNLFNCFINKEE